MPSARGVSDLFGAGSLTDVHGLRVGHHGRLGGGWRTGTTVVFAPDGAMAAVDIRGGGPGTRETDALDPGNLVDRIHAVCLTGGSAYGLAAAHGVVEYLEQCRLGVPVGPDPHHVVPVVPAAVIFDLGRGGAFGSRPDAAFGAAAIAASKAVNVPRGAVGAGLGARAGGLQGGVGMASRRVDAGGAIVTVAALAVVNASGSVIDHTSGLPWCRPGSLQRPSAGDRRRLAALTSPSQPMNTTIGVVATDADLSRPESGRLAQSAHDGLARAIRPAHSLTDGDTVFGLATGVCSLPDHASGLLRHPASRSAALNMLFAAAADAFATACTDAVLCATRIGSDPSYRELCPTAFGDR